MNVSWSRLQRTLATQHRKALVCVAVDERPAGGKLCLQFSTMVSAKMARRVRLFIKTLFQGEIREQVAEAEGKAKKRPGGKGTAAGSVRRRSHGKSTSDDRVKGGLMSAIGNLLWLLGGGIVMGLTWFLCGILMFCTVVGIPWARSCFVLANLAFLPFGREAVSRKELSGKHDLGTGGLGLAGNVLWFVFGGIWLALGHAFWALLCAITVVGIPFAVQHLKLASLAMAPVGKTIVNKHVAQAAHRAEAEEYVTRRRRR